MAIETAMPVAFQGERAEMETVLHSAAFVRAPKLAQLLAYLCEKLFSGGSSQIKEYSIGVEVFGRGVDFDQDSDSIVRVEVNRLRRKLAEYYAGEGAGHALQITIPVGQYVPEFVHAVKPAAEPPVPREKSTSGELTQRDRKLLRGFRPEMLALGLVLLIVGFGSAWLIFRGAHGVPATAPLVQAPAPPQDNPLGPPPGQEVRILCGAGRSLVDHAGKLWSADHWFAGGDAVHSDALHIARTQDQGFYRTSRQGTFRYDIPLPAGRYELRLHFAETVFGLDGVDGEGTRLEKITANGKPLLDYFDILADAGGSRTADVKVFPEIAPAKDGQLHLEFAGENGLPAAVSAIEILPGLRGRIRPVRVLARQTPYYSNDSEWWSPDAYFEGGQIAGYSAPVRGTDDPEMFDTERWGNFTYAIPVAAGRYAVTLYFTVRHGEWPPNAPAGMAHIFNVFLNGRALLQNFDLARAAGESDVVVRRFTALEPNAQGKILLSFVPVSGYATVTGIEVIPQ